jgi:amphi-Trp domain-containing protein
MGKETRLFKSEERMGRAKAADFMRQIADKIQDGVVILRQGSEELTIQLSDQVILEIQVEDEEKGAKGIQHSLELEIKWYDSDAGQGEPVELG